MIFYRRLPIIFLNKQESEVIFDIPDENGMLIPYRVYQSHTMSSGLQEKAPEIRAYRAFGLHNKADIASIVITPDALHIGILRTGKSDLVVQPAAQDGKKVILYTKENLPPIEFECYVNDTYSVPATDLRSPLIEDEVLRTYRFAVGVTGEYSQFHVDRAGLDNTATDDEKKNVVLAAIVVTIDRINSVYERDLGVLLELVSTEKDVIFLDPNTDPYDNDDIMSMLNANTSVLNNYLGSNNYDGGHLFSTYPGGGISGLGIICSSIKAHSVTGLNNPVGDTYDIDFVAHEIGHAFGCNHTFANSCNNNRNLGTSMEPGSGSTIMGYAGVCAPNLQLHSDDYFHSVSIKEASDFVSNIATCSNNIDIGNHKPVINVINYGNDKYLPVNTPFILQATATDPDNDPLTYCWEQHDEVGNNDSNITSWTPDANHTSGPEFRSYDPGTSGDRIFPIVSNIISGTYSNFWEVLPGVDRTMKFALRVRDNHPGGGQSPVEYVNLSFDANTGPFRITNMTDNETWQVLTDHTITWDVAGTDGGLVNCATVDILFSADDGQTFPYTVVENLPNNGSATFTMPDFLNTYAGRFMLKAHDNYFMDIAKGKFIITGSNAVPEEKLYAEFEVYPNPANEIVNVIFESLNSNEKIILQMYDTGGRMLFSKEFFKSKNIRQNIELSAYGKGIYFISLNNGKKIFIRKLIIN